MYKVSKCFNCDLSLFRNAILQGTGVDDADILFVLDSPSKADDNTGQLLSNKTGLYFDYIMDKLNFKPYSFITYLVKCKTPNRQASSDEINACKSHFVEEFKEIRPKMVILCGSNVVRGFFNTQLPISYIHGTYRIVGNTIYCITYNLNILNKDIDTRTELIHDLIKFGYTYQQLNPLFQFNDLNKLYEI